MIRAHTLQFLLRNLFTLLCSALPVSNSWTKCKLCNSLWLLALTWVSFITIHAEFSRSRRKGWIFWAPAISNAHCRWALGKAWASHTANCPEIMVSERYEGHIKSSSWLSQLHYCYLFSPWLLCSALKSWKNVHHSEVNHRLGTKEFPALSLNKNVEMTFLLNLWALDCR